MSESMVESFIQFVFIVRQVGYYQNMSKITGRLFPFIFAFL